MNEEMEKTEQDSGNRLQTALDRELGRLLAGKAGLDECCAANPEVAAELWPLLQLALSGQEALSVEVPAAAREKTREKLLAQARGLLLQRRSSSSRLAMLRPLALATGLFLLLFAGSAVASSGSGPDSRLYPLKQRLESAHTTLAMQHLDQARVENSHANARLDELQKMLDNKRQEYIPDLLAHYDKNISDATAHAQSAAADGKDTAEIDALIQLTSLRHEEMLRKISDAFVEDEATQQPVRPEETETGAAQPSVIEPVETIDDPGALFEDAGHNGSGSDGNATLNHEGGSQSSPEREDSSSHIEESSHHESFHNEDSSHKEESDLKDSHAVNETSGSGKKHTAG